MPFAKLEPIMFLKIPIMLLSTTPKSILLCSVINCIVEILVELFYFQSYLSTLQLQTCQLNHCIHHAHYLQNHKINIH